VKEETHVVRAGRDRGHYRGPVNPPVYHASTVLFDSMAEFLAAGKPRPGKMTYGRWGTPTSFCLSDALAELEGGAGCALFPSGAAAIAATLLCFVEPGDHLLVPDNAYGATRRLCEQYLPKFQVSTTFYEPTLGAGISKLISPKTKIVYVESPGSMTLEVQDIPAIASAARAAGALTIMDNTWASPLFFKPFAHGVDVSIQAGTKYIVGHSDVMLGSVCGNEETWPAIDRASYLLGQCIGPDDAYLAQRGLRTLSVRLARHQESALKVAQWLAGHSAVERVHYPALPSDPGHALWRRDFAGASGLLSIRLRPVAAAKVEALVDGLKYFGIGASWGGYESLVAPVRPIRTATSWDSSRPLLRFHIGLESTDDLIGDLSAGLDRLAPA
jgi:cysteine-S-conjugate beta-lyase